MRRDVWKVFCLKTVLCKRREHSNLVEKLLIWQWRCQLIFCYTLLLLTRINVCVVVAGRFSFINSLQVWCAYTSTGLAICKVFLHITTCTLTTTPYDFGTQPDRYLVNIPTSSNNKHIHIDSHGIFQKLLVSSGIFSLQTLVKEPYSRVRPSVRYPTLQKWHIILGDAQISQK